MTLVALFDWHHASGSRTHIGAAVERITTGGVQEAWDIIQRKLAVEGRLLYHSAWAVPLWVCVVSLVYAQRNWSKEMEQRLKGLLYGGSAAVAACIAVNDAGAVAAALCGTVVLSGLYAARAQKTPHQQAMLSGGGRVEQ